MFLQAEKIVKVMLSNEPVTILDPNFCRPGILEKAKVLTRYFTANFTTTFIPSSCIAFLTPHVIYNVLAGNSKFQKLLWAVATKSDPRVVFSKEGAIQKTNIVNMKKAAQENPESETQILEVIDSMLNVNLSTATAEYATRMGWDHPILSINLAEKEIVSKNKHGTRLSDVTVALATHAVKLGNGLLAAPKYDAIQRLV